MAFPLRDDRPSRRTPWVTYGLILANVVVFLFVQPAAFQATTEDDFFGTGLREASEFLYQWGAIPCELQNLEPLAELDCGGVGGFAPAAPAEDKSVLASLFTSLFLHAEILHLSGNMLFLWIFGNNVEDRLGHVTYLGFYVLWGLIATLGHTLASLGDTIPVIGASGAIAGVMGAYVVFRPRDRILSIVPWFVFQVVYIPAFAFLGLYFAAQFFYPEGSNVAWVAHAAGMAGGAVLAFGVRSRFTDPYRSERRSALEAEATGRPPRDVRAF